MKIVNKKADKIYIQRYMYCCLILVMMGKSIADDAIRYDACLAPIINILE